VPGLSSVLVVRTALSCKCKLIQTDLRMGGVV